MDLIFAGLLMERVYNFSSGLAVLPLEVLKEAHAIRSRCREWACLRLQISHRSPGLKMC